MAHVTATVETFAEKLTALRKQAHKHPVFVVWTAEAKDDKLPPTTWCPDCNRCVPAVRQVAKDKGVYLLEVSVGPVAEYKSEDFFLRSLGTQDIYRIRIATMIKDSTKKELESAPSHDAAVAVAEAFVTKNNVTCSAFKCPVFMTGVSLGVILLAAGAAFAYSQRRAAK